MKKTPKMLEVERNLGEPLEEFLRRAYIQDGSSTVKIGEQLGVANSTIGRWFEGYGIRTQKISEAKLPKGVTKPTREEIEMLYVHERKSIFKIAKILGVSESTAHVWLQSYGIKIRSRSEANLPNGIRKPTLEQLNLWYSTQRMSIPKIARKLEVDNTTVLGWLKNYGIHRRNLSEAVSEGKLPEGVTKPSREQLENWYIQEGRNTYQIAEQVGVNNTTVSSWLRSYNITVRNNSEANLPTGIKKPNKEQLNRWYVGERKSSIQIAKDLGISSTVVRYWLEDYGIPRRDISQSLLSKDVVKPTKEILENWYLKEKKSTVQIATELGVTDTTVARWLRNCGIKVRKEGIYSDRQYRIQVVDDLLGKLGKQPEELMTSDFGKAKQKNNKAYFGVLYWYKEEYQCKPAEALNKLLEDLYRIKPEQLNRRFRSNHQFVEFLKRDETAKNLAATSLVLNGQGLDIEQVITDIYEGRFKDQEHLNRLLQDNSEQIYDLIRAGSTSLGGYLGGFRLGDRNIVPVLLGQALATIPEERITPSLEERLVRILRFTYSPRFNDNPQGTIAEIKNKVETSQGKVRKLYDGLNSHYTEVLSLAGELR